MKGRGSLLAEVLPAGATKMDPDFVLQLANGLLLCWLGTEVALSGKPPSLSRTSAALLGGWAALNGVVLLSQLDGLRELGPSSGLAARAAAAAAAPFTWPLAGLHHVLHASLGPRGVLGLLGALGVGGAALARQLRLGDTPCVAMRRPLVWGSFLGTWGALWGSLAWGDAFPDLEPELPLRVLVIGGAYYGLSLWDMRRRRPDMPAGEFLSYFLLAAGQSAAVLPLAVVAIAAGFLLLVTLLEAVHLPVTWLNWPIYYGALYGPFATVYYFAKQRALSARLLPA